MMDTALVIFVVGMALALIVPTLMGMRKSSGVILVWFFLLGPPVFFILSLFEA